MEGSSRRVCEMFWLLVLVLALARSGLARYGPDRDCSWDPSLDRNQGLDPTSLAAGARLLGESAPVSDADGCRAACCAHARCDLAVLGLPADGPAQCMLVHCTSRGRDVCALTTSSQFQVFRRARAEPRADARDGGNEPHVVALLGVSGGRSNESGTGESLMTSHTGAGELADRNAEGPVYLLRCSSV